MAPGTDPGAVWRAAPARDGAPLYRRVRRYEHGGGLCLRGMWTVVVFIRHQIPFGIRLAELLGRDRQRQRRIEDGYQLWNAARGNSLRTLRLAPRSRL